VVELEVHDGEGGIAESADTVELLGGGEEVTELHELISGTRRSSIDGKTIIGHLLDVALVDSVATSGLRAERKERRDKEKDGEKRRRGE